MDDSPEWRRICRSTDVPDGAAERFDALVAGDQRPCVLLRVPESHEVVAYVNICLHRNWPIITSTTNPIDSQGRVECKAHGAFYLAATGECLSGPCAGDRLTALRVREQDGHLWVAEDVAVDDSVYAAG